ncbi:MAG: response regulator [Phycisphaerales bacterium]|nr:response regulator [Phycisphaerales bacterium]
MEQSARGNGPIRTIRVNEAQLESILNDLDSAGDQVRNDRRKAERYRYRGRQVRADIQQPGDASFAPYYICPRNISEGGLSFIHGGFVHIGSKCLIHLITVRGTQDSIEGVVVSCRLLQQNLHEVGVRFRHGVDPSEFCQDAARLSVLLVDDDPAMTRLATRFLNKLNAEVDHAENGQIAIEKSETKVYDLILMDIAMPVLGGIEATKVLRERSYSGPIVAATVMAGAGDREKCLEAGCDDYLPKPYSFENLAALLKSLEQKPIFSTFADDPSMKEIIQLFVDELPSKVRKIADTAVRQNLRELSILVRSLKGESAGYGFECISDVAGNVEKMILQGCDHSVICRAVKDLLRLCLQVRSSSRTNRSTGKAEEAPA